MLNWCFFFFVVDSGCCCFFALFFFFFCSFFFFLHAHQREHEVLRGRLNEVAHNGVPIDVPGQNDHRIGSWS